MTDEKKTTRETPDGDPERPETARVQQATRQARAALRTFAGLPEGLQAALIVVGLLGGLALLLLLFFAVQAFLIALPYLVAGAIIIGVAILALEYHARTAEAREERRLEREAEEKAAHEAAFAGSGDGDEGGGDEGASAEGAKAAETAADDPRAGSEGDDRRRAYQGPDRRRGHETDRRSGEDRRASPRGPDRRAAHRRSPARPALRISHAPGEARLEERIRKVIAERYPHIPIVDDVDRARFFVVLLSPAYLSMDDCCAELEKALSTDALVIPVIAKDCRWKMTAVRDRSPFPASGKPVGDDPKEMDVAARGVAMLVGTMGSGGAQAPEPEPEPEDEPDALPVLIRSASDDVPYAAALSRHLAPMVEVGTIRLAAPGSRPADARIVVVLVTPDFLEDAGCQADLGQAFLAPADAIEIVPIIVRDCAWRKTRLADLAPRPADGRAVTAYEDPGKAWTDAVDGIQAAVDRVRARKA